ncbi:MAG TPA: glycosyltransferase [Solirubrobacteraceae bacterium]|nr:glycosyltransferase [Solirubrobacteraceae bacterium]
MTPRVSVCIPTRDQAEYLGAALASVLREDVDGGLEVLVHDDASSDDTARVVAAFGGPRVRYRRHPAPLGVGVNRNTLLAGARGDYVAWLDSDDVRRPGTLARQVALLDAHPEVVLAHGGHGVIDADGRALPDWPAPFAHDAIEPSAVAFANLVATNEMTTSTVVVRRSAHDAAGPFATTIGASSTDWEMWLRIALRGAVAYSAERVADYRQHARTISRATAAGGERLRCNVRVVRLVLREERLRIPHHGRARATAEAGLAAQALLHAGDAYTRGDPAAALDTIALADRFTATASTRATLDRLCAATARGDDAACLRETRAALAALADALDGTRFGARLRRESAPDEGWDAQLARAGAAVARATPADAVIAAIAKWDPAILDRCGRDGVNFPDRALLPDGYPRDGATAVAHLEALRARRGVTHVVVPQVSGWWLEHYPELARRLGTPLWRDTDCAIFDVGAAR